MDELLTLPAVGLAARIRAGDVSPVEVVDAHIARLEAIEPVINAIVADRFEAARAEARRAEAAVVRGEASGALHGVPFTAKEMVSVRGMPHTFGTLDRRDHVAARDATAVTRLRGAGAIPLGVTNVPEWGFWFETDNLIYGRTNNPYDASRTPGGSSGGEGAVIAAGGSPFGVGSDIGGSIRIPAAFCGIFGHKPTHGVVPLTGHHPVYTAGPEHLPPRRSPWLAIGPLARSSHDLMPLLRIMAGPDGVDPNTEAVALGDPADVRWRGRRVLLLDDPRIDRAGRAERYVRHAVRTAARALEAEGATVEPLPADLFRRAVDLWGAALGSTGGPTFCETIGVHRWRALLREFARTLARRPRLTVPVLLFCLGERLTRLSERRVRRLADEGRRLARDVSARLGGDGLLLMPPHPRVAPKHGRPLFRPFDFAYTAVLNVLRIPVTVAPMGLDAAGLPVAVQIAGPRGRDHATIAAAAVLERAIGGWRPAMPVDGAAHAHDAPAAS